MTAVSRRPHLRSLVERHSEEAVPQFPHHLFLQLATKESNFDLIKRYTLGQKDLLSAIFKNNSVSRQCRRETHDDVVGIRLLSEIVENGSISDE